MGARFRVLGVYGLGFMAALAVYAYWHVFGDPNSERF